MNPRPDLPDDLTTQAAVIALLTLGGCDGDYEDAEAKLSGIISALGERNAPEWLILSRAMISSAKLTAEGANLQAAIRST